MMQRFHFSFFSLFFLFNFAFAQQNHLIQFEGKPIFINGLNVAWNKFGGDVGNHYMWGSMYDAQWFEELFAQCENHGINCVRLWIHTDGRGNPEFDANGFVKGVDGDFFADLDDIFLRAKNHGILIMPCLWSFDMCKDFTGEAGVFAGKHEALISDSLKTLSYINKVLIPMVKRYSEHCNLFAWEIINEPEWAISRPQDENSNWAYTTDVTVELKHMQRFTAMLAAAIHKNSNKMVTTGCAALRWSSNVAPAVGNWYGDKELQNVYADSNAYLNFYQIHYYDYMHSANADPFDTNYSYEYWKMDKPCLIGEQPGNLNRDSIYSNSEKINNAFKNHYAGHMFWSYNGYDGIGSFKDFKNECKVFANENKELVQPFIPCKTMSASNLQFKIQYNAAKKRNELKWRAENPKTLVYFDLEKSEDGIHFILLQRFPANENGDEYYFYNDKSNAACKYRLKYKDSSGFEAVSQIYFSEN